MKILFDSKIRAAAPSFKMLLVEADIKNEPTSEALWQLIIACQEDIRRTTPMEQIRLRPAIDATRTVYKRCGKDPNRYRPSAEALCRRAVKGMDLYRTLTAIDLINLLSMQTGHSIGGFDAGKIDGDTLTLGVGQAGEPYQAIGRGELNIEGLPVYRDATGGIGTPTSDNERTKLDPSTSRLLMTVNIYGDDPDHDTDTVERLCRQYLKEYAGATDIKCQLIIPDESNR